MRKIIPVQLEMGRFRHPIAGIMGSGLTGAFLIEFNANKLRAIASESESVECAIGMEDSKGWEHVSVSLRNRCPNWDEMSYVKDLFWAEDETVVQYHPKKSEYVNCHPYVLHMWRNVQFEFRLPPSIFVGPDSAKGK